MAKSLFVGNLSYSTREETLKNAFAKYGASGVRIVEGRGFGFVDVADDQAAAAINDMHDTELDGRKIIVNEARPREPRSGGGGGGGGYRGGGGGGGRDRDRGGRGGRDRDW